MLDEFMIYMYIHREDDDFKPKTLSRLKTYLASDESTDVYVEKLLELFLAKEVKINSFTYINIFSEYIFQNGQPLRLTPIEKKIVCILAQYADDIVPYDKLTNIVWGYAPDNSILKVNISNIRKYGIPIETIKGMGYRLRSV